VLSKKPISAWLPSIDRGLGFHLPIQINNKIFALAKNMPGAAGDMTLSLTKMVFTKISQSILKHSLTSSSRFIKQQ
jgi:hypothetical protein